jgi:hypothetical protein
MRLRLRARFLAVARFQLGTHGSSRTSAEPSTTYRSAVTPPLCPTSCAGNGAPFASGNALFGLSTLAVWWLRLGIKLQRIKPANPQQNGRHERMHLTLKPPSPLRSTSFNNKSASIASSNTTMNGRTRRSAAPTRPICIHPQRVFTARRCPNSSIPTTIAPSS